jgi:hypothetical protein
MALSYNNEFAVFPPKRNSQSKNNFLCQSSPKVERTLEQQSSRKIKAGRFITKGGFNRKRLWHIRQGDMRWQSGASKETDSLGGCWFPAQAGGRLVFAIQILVAPAIRDRIFRNKESLGKVSHSIITAFLSDLMLGN